jgi:diacylglycerol kinase family enzyme
MLDPNRPAAGRRFAALAAIASVVGSVVCVTLGALNNLPILVAEVLAMIVAVIGGWWMVSRRGAARLVATAVVVIALVSFVATFFVGDPDWAGIVAGLVLAAVSVGAAKRALPETPREDREPPADAQALPRAQHPVLLMNPKSGGGKAERFHLVDECRKRGIEPIVLAKGDDLIQLTEDAIARGADVIGMAGGDGSQALVSSVASKHGIPCVVIPAGTRNHFALDLGLDRDDVVGALDAFVDGVERTIDLAEVNGRVFVNNASLGLYAKIVQSDAYRDAKVKTTADKLPDLLGPDAEPLDLRFTAPDGTEVSTAHLIQVSNDPYDLRHLVGGGARPRLDLGVLGIVTLKVGDSAQDWSAPAFEVRSGGPVEIGVDGEALTMEPPLSFSSRPGALRVRLPRQAPGLSPSAKGVRISRSTVHELFHIAMGRPT